MWQHQEWMILKDDFIRIYNDTTKYRLKPKEQDYISITDDKGVEYKFEKPEWWNYDTCEFLKLIERHIIGYIGEGCSLCVCHWHTNGNLIFTSSSFRGKYNLKPYKSKKERK